MLSQAARRSHPLEHGLASLAVMRGLSAARRCSAAGCAASTFDVAALRRSGRSAAKCDRLQPTAVGCATPAPLPQSTALLCGRLWSAALLLCCSGLWPRGCDRLRCCLAAASPPDYPTAPLPRLRRAFTPSELSRRHHRAIAHCGGINAALLDLPMRRRLVHCGGIDPAPLDPPMRRRRAHGAAAASTPLRLIRPCAAAAPTALRRH